MPQMFVGAGRSFGNAYLCIVFSVSEVIWKWFALLTFSTSTKYFNIN